ncbi:MAG: UMP kinase [Beijerinckiaceae bacterium]|jgi:uridylate kinase
MRIEKEEPRSSSQKSRILIKLSGEALAGEGAFGLDPPTVARIARDLGAVHSAGHQVAVVVGGGNFFRGVKGLEQGIDRARGDSIGMLATLMNALALEGALESLGFPARTQSAVPAPSICESYSRQQAGDHLGRGRIVVLGGGTGNPYFTTDTAAVLRAAELSCDLVVKATQVDGVYSADPRTNPKATRFDELSHAEAIARDLKIMDTAAFALAREARLSIIVAALSGEHAIADALCGRRPSTRVTP